MVVTRNKSYLFILVGAVILVTSLLTYLTFGQKNLYKPGVSLLEDKAVNQALNLYQEKVVLGVDFSNGPCLSNDLLPGWVADIVHTPRQKVDDQPKNQCPAFTEGRAKHFVELDLKGEVVRVQ